MDIEHLTHSSYRVSVIVAVVLSAMVVTITALLGRGALNLKGALLLTEPTDVTVIALVEPKLEDGVTISSIDLLRKEEKSQEERPIYAYRVGTSDDESYLVRIRFSPEETMWQLLQFEYLHGAPARSQEGGF